MSSAGEASRLNVEFQLIPETLVDPFRSDFFNYADGLVRGTPGGFVLSPEYGKNADLIYNFPLREDDTWVVTFPKCGTTWTQEMVWLLINDCDFEGAKQPLGLRSPFFEFPFLLPKAVDGTDFGAKLMQSTGGLEPVNQLPSPRVIKTHLPIYLLNPKLLDTCKVVYVARNPKDVIVSFFYHHKLIKFHDFSGDLEKFAEYFMKNEVMFGPFFPHLLEAWELRHHPNLLFVFYEDFKKDLKGSIKKVADFLNKSLTEEQLTKLTEHLRIDNFAKNDAVNYEVGKEMGFMKTSGRFIRKGKTGDWKNHFNPELNERVDRWIESNLAGSDLKFVTELDQQD